MTERERVFQHLGDQALPRGKGSRWTRTQPLGLTHASRLTRHDTHRATEGNKTTSRTPQQVKQASICLRTGLSGSQGPSRREGSCCSPPPDGTRPARGYTSSRTAVAESPNLGKPQWVLEADNMSPHGKAQASFPRPLSPDPVPVALGPFDRRRGRAKGGEDSQGGLPGIKIAVSRRYPRLDDTSFLDLGLRLTSDLTPEGAGLQVHGRGQPPTFSPAPMTM